MIGNVLTGVRRRIAACLGLFAVMTAQAQLTLLTDRLKTAGKGIILLHDPKAQTAAMLPAFLRYLRDNKYRIVHLVPRAQAATAAGPERPK